MKNADQLSIPARLLWIVVFLVLLVYALVVGKRRSERAIDWISEKLGAGGTDDVLDEDDNEETGSAPASVADAAEVGTPIVTSVAPAAPVSTVGAKALPARARSQKEIAAGIAADPAYTAAETIGARRLAVKKVARKRVFFYQYANHIRRVLPGEVGAARHQLGILTRACFGEAGLPFGINSAAILTELLLRSEATAPHPKPRSLHVVDVNAALADASAGNDIPPWDDLGQGYADGVAVATPPSSVAPEVAAPPSPQVNSAKVTPIRAEPRRKPVKVGVGRIVDMGEREFTPEGRKPYRSFSITLEMRGGNRKAFSGEHLAELVGERHVRQGDTVKISMLGRVAVQVPHPTKAGAWMNAHRNEFDIRHVRAHAA
ncbi:hypothetical protein ACU4GI_47170 (plasmid) [Cupriavidus basilensis]